MFSASEKLARIRFAVPERGVSAVPNMASRRAYPVRISASQAEETGSIPVMAANLPVAQWQSAFPLSWMSRVRFSPGGPPSLVEYRLHLAD
jgi:hypothetical protein